LIRINKSSSTPAVLLAQGPRKTGTLKSSYTRNPSVYNNGTKNFRFFSNIYGHSSVKSALKRAQSDKCYFCESKVSSVAYGDVEHFRPKGGFKQYESDALGKPGYYWLAYNWENLFYSCQICNQRFKKNLFPLENNNIRCLNHHGSLTNEAPILINPSDDNPENLISFRKEIPYPVNGNKRGRQSIKILGLDRPELTIMRERKYKLIKYLNTVANLDPPLIPDTAEARVLLNELSQDDAEFSSMVRAALRDGFTN